MAADPVAKRAALRSTPEKMKATQRTKIGINVMDKEKSVGLTQQQRKYQSEFVGLMAPTGPASIHPAAPLLLELATLGCCSAMGEPWTLDMMVEAIAKNGAHPSALVP
jgi:hypothetical protein